MIKKITLSAFFLFSLSVFSQMGPVGHLTIFSEDGEKFSLILNGELINTDPQTNLRVEDLNQPYYNAKIVFENKTLNEISKNNLMLSDLDGNLADVTYKIKRDKNNKAKSKLVFYSEAPVQQGYIAPSNIHVIHYGQPDIMVVQGHGGTTTTTTTEVTDGVSFGANVNAGGVNLNINVQDSGFNSGIKTTTTSTTSTTSSGHHDNHSGHNQRGCGGKYPMAAGNFNDAFNTVKKQGFEDTRLKTAKQIVAANCLSVNQISQIANTFGFEENKLDFAKFAYDYCTEPQNYFKLNNIFNFSTNVDELSDYVASRQH